MQKVNRYLFQKIGDAQTKEKLNKIENADMEPTIVTYLKLQKNPSLFVLKYFNYP